MKKYTMLSALWLFACGAGAGQEPADDSTLQSPLTANDDDDATDSTEPPTGHTGSAEEPEGDDAGDCEGPAAPVGGAFPAGPGSAAPGGVPDLVIGAGGTAWAPPQGASVVWCNVDVPIGCPAISPAPEGGRLVVVHGMTEASGTAMGTAGSGSGTAMGTAGSGSGSEWSAPADDPAINAGGTFVVYASPDTAGAAPSTEVPVIIGGSLPPLPGTCVAVTFPTAGGTIGDAPIPGGAPSAGGERVSVPAGAPSAGGESGSVPASDPTSGASPASGTAAGGAPAFPGMLPALPPPGGCLDVTFPTAPDHPALPGQPVPDGSVAPVPAAPSAGACVNVAFATSADPDQPTPSPVPVMCAFPVASPGAGVAAAPSAGGESTPDEDLR